MKFPLFLSRVAAGFPSPADDYVENKLDLHKHLIKNPAATFFVKAEGDSMILAGVHSGDLLVVDRSLEAKNGSMVLAILDGEFTVKKFRQNQNKVWLEPANHHFQPIEITPEIDFEVWGVVTSSIHSTL